MHNLKKHRILKIFNKLTALIMFLLENSRKYVDFLTETRNFHESQHMLHDVTSQLASPTLQ